MPTRKTWRTKELDHKIKRCILSYQARNGLELGITQTGGGQITVNGFRFPYIEYDEGSYIAIRGRLTKTYKPCFVLFIEKDNTAVLDNVENSKCSLDEDAESKHAAKAAFAIAKEKGVSRIYLTDNSSKQIAPDTKFYLSDMYFLTTGQTWYESFLPIHLDKSEGIPIDLWREIVRTNTWAHVFNNLKRKHPDITIPVNISDIDPVAPGSAIKVLNRIKDAKTDFFARYKLNLPGASDIATLRGPLWIADL
jgi:hypothetical protein